jgi:hypothetical protein
MALSIPRTEAAVIRHFHERMLYGLFIPPLRRAFRPGNRDVVRLVDLGPAKRLDRRLGCDLSGRRAQKVTSTAYSIVSSTVGWSSLRLEYAVVRFSALAESPQPEHPLHRSAQ